MTIFYIIILPVIILGITFKILHYPGANIFTTIGSFMLAFLVGPLAFIIKYEKWRYYARSSKNAILLSLTDLIGKIGIITGLLFKLTHWPAANFLIGIGSIFFIVSYLIWSHEFQKEVVLRKDAEDKLKDSLEQVSIQKKGIEEKNEELSQLVEEINSQKEEIVIVE